MLTFKNSAKYGQSRQIWWRRSGAGFTLIELLISIAITGFLAAIMFTNFSQEKNRNALKGIVHQLQTDIQKMQTNAQGGVVTGTNVPLGYGVYVPRNGTNYIYYADLNGNGVYDVSPTDTVLQTVTIPTTLGVTVSKISNNGGLNYSRLDIVFNTPNGTANNTGKRLNNPFTNHAPNVATIFIRSSKLNLCYAITVTAGVGTVSQKELTSVSSC